MHRSSALNEVAFHKAELRAEAARIRRDLGAHAKGIQSFAELAQLGIDAVKQLKRSNGTASTILGVWTAYTALRGTRSSGFLKPVLTCSRLLSRVLPVLRGSTQPRQSSRDLAEDFTSEL